MKKRYIVFFSLIFVLFATNTKATTYNICAGSGSATKSGNTITWSNITVPYNYSSTASYTASYVGTADSVNCSGGYIEYPGSDIKINGLASGYTLLATNVSVTSGKLSITSTNFKKYLVIVDSNDPTRLRTYVDISKLLDSTKPSISNCKISNQTTTSYKVTCTVSDNVGVTSVKFPTWTSAGGQDDLVWHNGTISGNQAYATISISSHNNEVGVYITDPYAYDAAGNSSSTRVTTTIDKTAPTCTNSGDSTEWTSSDRTIIYGCSDASGCDTSFNGGSVVFNETTTTATIPSYTIKDIYGNTKTCPARIANVYVDKTVPEITNLSTSTTTTKMTVVVAANDEETGIAKYEFKLDDGDWQENDTEVIVLNNLKNQEHKLNIRVSNSVGLTSEKEIFVKLSDLGMPEFSVEPDTTDWVEERKVTIIYPKGYDGEVYRNEYSLDGLTWYEYKEPLIFNEIGIVYARVVDSSENTGNISTYSVINVGNTGYCPYNTTLYNIDKDGNIQTQGGNLIEIKMNGIGINGGFLCLNNTKKVIKARLIRGKYILNYNGKEITIEE